MTFKSCYFQFFINDADMNIPRSGMQRYTDAHMKILPELHTQTAIFLYSISGSIYAYILERNIIL